MKKIIAGILAFLFFASSVFAYTPTGRMSGGMKGGMRDGIDNKERIKRLMPYGLTFYKDYSAIPNGTYVGSSSSAWLNADYSIGSPVAIFTSTDGNFVIDGGYKTTVANKDVLKYLILGNRTAAQETIVIKVSFPYNFADKNWGFPSFLSTDTKNRRFSSNQDIPDISFTGPF